MSDSYKGDGVTVQLRGLAEFRAKLATLPAKVQRGELRTLMRDAMRLVRDSARGHAPKLDKPVLGPGGTPRRLPGTLRKAISVRTSKRERRVRNAIENRTNRNISTRRRWSNATRTTTKNITNH